MLGESELRISNVALRCVKYVVLLHSIKFNISSVPIQGLHWDTTIVFKELPTTLGTMVIQQITFKLQSGLV